MVKKHASKKYIELDNHIATIVLSRPMYMSEIVEKCGGMKERQVRNHVLLLVKRKILSVKFNPGDMRRPMYLITNSMYASVDECCEKAGLVK